jgi:hypothetical protein
MGINTRWDNREKTVVLLEFETEWSFSDLEDAIRRVDEMITSVDHQVDVLIDVEGAKLPKDVMNMAKMLISTGEARANEGNRIVVGASSVIRQGYTAILKMFPDKLNGRQLLFADDVSHARAVLNSLR